jgi:hypothetical protein
MDNIEEGYESILMWRNVPNYDKVAADLAGSHAG